MNSAHLHLLFNHFPIIVPIVGLLVMIAGLMFRSDILKRASYFIFILGALSTFPAMNTGEEAEEAIEHMQGVDEKMIKHHEEEAETFSLLSYILGGISLLGVWANIKKKSFSTILSMVTVVYIGLMLFFAVQTGITGGEIRHPEIRKGNNSVIQNTEGETGDND
jgi:uncharacterized membrane protein